MYRHRYMKLGCFSRVWQKIVFPSSTSDVRFWLLFSVQTSVQCSQGWDMQMVVFEVSGSFLTRFFCSLTKCAWLTVAHFHLAQAPFSLGDVKSFLGNEEITYWQSWRNNECSKNVNYKKKNSQNAPNITLIYHICLNLRRSSETDFSFSLIHSAVNEIISWSSWRLHRTKTEARWGKTDGIDLWTDTLHFYAILKLFKPPKSKLIFSRCRSQHISSERFPENVWAWEGLSKMSAINTVMYIQ